MSVDQCLSAFKARAIAIGRLRGARAEQSLYGPFGTFLHDAAASLRSPVTVVQQVGALNIVPDYGLFRSGHIVGWVELKAPTKDLDRLRGHDLRQFHRALESLEGFVLTNGWDWRYFEQGELVGSAALPEDFLTNPGSQPTRQQLIELELLLGKGMGRTPMPIGSPENAIQLMARRAQAVRHAVELEMRNPTPLVQALFEEFRGLVYASGRTYTHEDFADAYGQTVIFGLLLALITSGATVSTQTVASRLGTERHPFLARCIQLLTDPSLPPDLRGALEEAVTAINRIEPTLFAGSGATQPILSAYEQFFAAYDPSERAARGVYYTPPHVVSHQIAGIQRMLRDAFGMTGLGDRSVTYREPATGTGTYLLGLLTSVEAELKASGAPADVELEALVGERLHAFELMVGPYSVAHQRMEVFLREHNAFPTRRLPIYLVDTLAETLAGAAQSRFGVLGSEIAGEREAAERVKREEPILVILGNPPYDRMRRAQLGDQWMQGLLDDIKDRTPRGDRANLKALYDYYVAFWRWAAWLVAERLLPTGQSQQRAIVAYITNRSWLVGRAFGGLRSLLSELAREIWVLDLGGDRRTSHTRLKDDNVFDVGVGVAITFVVVDANRPGLPTVRYRRLWGARGEKEQQLGLAFDPADYRTVVRATAADPLTPVEWGALAGSPNIEQIFTQHETGVQTSRDSLLVGIGATDLLDLSGHTPRGTVGEWSLLVGDERDSVFHLTRTHPKAPQSAVTAARLQRYAYRPMDYRVIYNDSEFVEWPRPTLQSAFSSDNLALITIERGFGPGPAAIPVDALPDLHVFRGFAGARGVYPLYGPSSAGHAQQRLGQEAAGHINLAPRVMRWAESVLHEPTPEAVFAYVTGLLNAPSYTATFEGGLAVERPRIPLTLDSVLAAKAVEIGEAVVDAWLLRRDAPHRIRWDDMGKTAPLFGNAEWRASDRLMVAGRCLDGVTHDAWEFTVSGYPVLRRYCRDRKAYGTCSQSLAELRQVASAVHILLELGVSLDELLLKVLDSDLMTW